MLSQADITLDALQREQNNIIESPAKFWRNFFIDRRNFGGR